MSLGSPRGSTSRQNVHARVPGHRRTVAVLVRGGIDVDRPGGNGVRPLAHARRRGRDEVAGPLYAAGARR